MKRVLVALLLLPAPCALAQGKAPISQVVDSGSFGIFVNNRRIGTEKFTIDQRSDASVMSAEIKVDDGTNKSEQSCEMQVGRDGKLSLYKWRSKAPRREESIVEPRDEFLIEHLAAADEKKRDIPYVLPLTTIILDDNFFTQRELLVWRYLATGCLPEGGQLNCAPSKFFFLVPRQHAQGSATVALLGREKITVKGVETELNKLTLDADGVRWLIWVDDRYKVIKMAVPSANLEVRRD